MLNNLVESNVGSNRDAIKADLLEKIVYDDPVVFKRLRVDQVDSNFVATCAASFKTANTEDIDILVKLAEQASKKTSDALEDEENQDKANDSKKEERSGNHGAAEEKKMYDPLVRLFSYIANFDQATTRKFQKTNGMLKADEPHTFGFPSCSPDLTISMHGIDASTSKLWRDRDAFGEVKPSNKQGPKPATPGAIPPIVTQSADYARLFMSARPFMLFCVGILIFGTEFCVGIYDRDGVTFSPVFDMFEDTDTLIRVVRTLGCHLSVEELGFDPTVRLLSDLETQKLTGNTKYPSAVVSSCGNDPRQWCTIGPPIWASLSLLGRGTNVWRVREYVVNGNEDPYLQGKEMIMKTAWRSSARISESDIYLSIDQPPEGLAKFECGGDVWSAGYPITMQNLRRKAVYDLDIDPPTPVLHRLVLGTIGRPLWEYTSDLDLLSGFCAALQAHKALCDRSILHRDISPGNVMLTEDQNVLLRGFITDLEFARLESATVSKPQRTVTINVGAQNKYDDRGRVRSRTEPTTRTHINFHSTVTVKRGAGMTGTAQFMAQRILLQSVSISAERTVHEAAHDVESFIWVLSYSVMRNLYHRASQRSASKEVRDERVTFRNLFSQAFGQTTPRAIAAQRQSGSFCLVFPEDNGVNKIISSFMSNGLISLFKNLRGLIHYATDPFNPTPLTHVALLAVINNAVDSLLDR